MKKMLFCLTALLLLCACAAAEPPTEGSCGPGLTWTLDADGLLTVTGSGAMEDYAWNRLPAWTEGGRVRRVVLDGVTHVGDYAFSRCTSLTEVSLGGAESVGSSAFEGCGALYSCPLPAGLRSIGAYAFGGCAIPEITIPLSVTEIGEAAFGGELSAIRVAEGHSAFTAVNGVLFTADMRTLLRYPPCRAGTSYTVPEGVEALGTESLSSCNFLTAVYLPDTLTAIGSKAFKWTQNIPSIRIPDSVTSIGWGAFNITGLEQITIPGGVTVLEDGVFAYCDALRSVTLPDSIVSIGDEAFAGCVSLGALRLPAALESIGADAFADAGSLRGSMLDLRVPDTVDRVGDGAFLSAAYRLICPEGGAAEAYALTYGHDHVTFYAHTLELPLDTVSIGDEAFARLGEHVNIRIPPATVSISDSAFEQSTVLLLVSEGSFAAAWAEEKELPWLAEP